MIGNLNIAIDSTRGLQPVLNCTFKKRNKRTTLLAENSHLSSVCLAREAKCVCLCVCVCVR